MVYKNIPITFSIIALIFFQNPESKYFDFAEISPGIISTFNGDYLKACQFWNNKIIKNPESPAWYLYKASTFLCKMEDTGDYSQKKDFMELIDKVLEKTENRADDYYKHLYKGLAFGYRGTIKMKTGNLFGGMRDGLKSSGELQTCISLKNDAAEPYVFLGIYKYWKSKSLKSLTWLPGIKDERNEGIYLIKSNLVQSSPLYFLTMQQLAWIYIDNKNYDDAIQIMKEGLVHFPESRLFLYPLAEAFERKGNLTRAIELYKKVGESLNKNNFGREYSWFKINLKIAELYCELNQFVNSKNFIDKIFDAGLEKYSFYSKKKILKRALQLREALMEIM